MLTGEQIRQRGIVAPPDGPAADQVQPNGIDISLEEVWRLAAPGQLGRDKADRVLPAREPVEPDAEGWYTLPTGTYVFRFTESVAMPRDCGGLAFPRSSLLRMGVHVPTAVWDAGYSGRGESILVVGNPHGVRLQRGARIAQLVVWQLDEPIAGRGYAGRYQGEGLPPSITDR